MSNTIFSISSPSSTPLAFGARRRRGQSAVPQRPVLNPLTMAAGERQPIAQEHTFLVRTPHETTLGRDAAALDSTAKLLLQRFPLTLKPQGSKTAPTPVTWHGFSDGREPLSWKLFMLRHAAQHRNFPWLALETEATRDKRRAQEASILKRLASQFPLRGVEFNPTLVTRAQSGNFELTMRDVTNIGQTIEPLPGHTTSFLGLLDRHTRFHQPETRDEHTILEVSPALKKGLGGLKHGDIFADIRSMPGNQALVAARNSVGYTPDRLEEYLTLLREKLADRGLLNLGIMETVYGLSYRHRQGQNLFETLGYRPIEHKDCAWADLRQFNFPPYATVLEKA